MHPFGDQVGEQVGGLGGGGAAHRRAVLTDVRRERRLPQGQRHLAAGRAVAGHRQHVEAGQPAGSDLGLRDGRRGQHEGRLGAVGRADPAQPAQDVRDVRAEDAPVVVTLVDHDVAQRAQERGPAHVPGQDRSVQHVGVGEHVVGVVAHPVTLVERAVAVVGARAQVHTQPDQRGELVLGERLGGRDVENGGAALPARAAALLDRSERRQLVGQRLAGRRAGRDHDVRTGVGGVGGRGLVPPQQGHAPLGQRRDQARRRPVRPLGALRGPPGQHLQVGQPVLAAGHRGQPTHGAGDSGSRLLGHLRHAPHCGLHLAR